MLLDDGMVDNQLGQSINTTRKDCILQRVSDQNTTLNEHIEVVMIHFECKRPGVKNEGMALWKKYRSG